MWDIHITLENMRTQDRNSEDRAKDRDKEKGNESGAGAGAGAGARTKAGRKSNPGVPIFASVDIHEKKKRQDKAGDKDKTGGDKTRTRKTTTPTPTPVASPGTRGTPKGSKTRPGVRKLSTTNLDKQERNNK